MNKLFCVALSFLPVLMSCTTDNYDKGEGKYSLMQAELVDLSINHQKEAVSFLLDDNSSFMLITPITASWVQTADTTYRAVLYFKKLTAETADAIKISSVPTLRAREHWKLEKQVEDPIDVESAWLSKNGKYLNLALLLKTGQADDLDATQTIGLAQDTIRLNPDQTHTALFRLLHDQAGVPEYYTSRCYVSILLPDTVQLDTIRLSIPTHSGIKERQFLP